MTGEPTFTTPVDGRRAPLADWQQRLEAGSRDSTVSLREIPLLAQVSLRVPVGDEATRAACSTALGVALPEQAGVASGDIRRSALWLGPDEWLIVGEAGSDAGLVSALEQAVAGVHASVVLLSANRTVLELSGPRARDVLQGGCRIDLHPRVFGPGSCVSTNVAQAQVYLHQVDDAPTYRLFVRNSFSGYLAEWLLDGMREYTGAQQEPMGA